MAFFDVHAQVVLPAVTGLAADAAINTFSYHWEDTTVEALAAGLSASVVAFYNDSPGTDPLSSYLSRSRSRVTDACEIKWFNITGHLNGTPAGPPVHIENWTLGPHAVSDSMPEEVALALSFHGDMTALSEFAGGTRPRARHRGRIYFGPLNSATIVTSGPSWYSRPTAALQGDLLAAGQALMDEANGWSVWSRRNAALYPVVGGWVDDSWDTIRGRGVDATFRDGFGSIV